MENWYRSPVAAFDVETTGLNVLEDRIVQAALVVVGPDGSVETEAWAGLIDPGVPVPAAASAIHGITDEVVRRSGIPAATAIPDLCRRFHELAGRNLPLVIFNAPFDWPFIHAEAVRHGCTMPGFNLIDPLVLDKGLDKFRRGKRTLVVTAHALGIRLDDAHSALADAVGAAAVARALAEKHLYLQTLPLSELQDVQAQWYSRSAESLEAYLRNRGDRGVKIDRGWPIPDSVKEALG